MSIEPAFGCRSEEDCRNYLKINRETVGILCKRCRQTSHRWIESKSLWRCRSCSFETTLKSGTLFESTKLPLMKWFMALGLMCNNKKGISACEMKRQLGLKRYEPVWYMMHKIRLAMKNYTAGDSKVEHVFASEMAMTNCAAVRKRVKPNVRNSSPLKLLSILENDPIPGTADRNKLHVLCYENLSGHQIRQQVASPEGIAYDLRNRRARKIVQPRGIMLSDEGEDIQPVTTPNWWISKALINLHRILNGIHHQVSKKYMQRHLDEFSFKFNNRYRRDLDNLLMINSLNRAG